MTDVRRRVLVLAIPALGALAADPVLSLVDTAFVGRIGSVELGALGVDAAIFNFAFAAFNFLAYATTPLVAQARGRGDTAESGRVVRRALSLAVVIGVVATVVLLVGSSLFVRVMQASPEVIEPAVAYLRLRAFALPAVLIVMAANGAFRGFLDTRTPLAVTLIINLINLVLDPLLIFGADLGLEGAAIATVIAQWLGAGIFLVLLQRRGNTEGWPRHRVGLAELRPFLSIGGVLILRTVLLVSSLSLATAVAARIGTVEVAAHQVVAQVWFLLAMIVDALAIAAQALVAEYVGRNDHSGARALSDLLLRWGLVVGVGLGVVVWASGPYIGPAFTTDPAVVDAIARVLPIAAVMQPVAALVFVADGIFLAVLATRLLAASTAAGFAAILAMGVATLGLGWGLAGVWWGMTAMIAARAVVLGRDYLSGSTLARS